MAHVQRSYAMQEQARTQFADLLGSRVDCNAVQPTSTRAVQGYTGLTNQGRPLPHGWQRCLLPGSVALPPTEAVLQPSRVKAQGQETGDTNGV